MRGATAALQRAGADAVRPRAIVFDWDNTLVSNWPTIHRAMNATLEAMGHPTWSYEETLSRVRLSMRESFPVLFGERWKEAGRIFYDHFADGHLDGLEPLPGSGELLADLTEMGLCLTVVSNKNGRFLRAEAAHLGWEGLFHRLVGAGDAERDKPAPEPVAMALEGTGLAAGEAVWFVGDADVDLECAANAACRGVLIRQLPPAAGEFDAHPPAWYVRDCRQLAALVRSLRAPI